RRVAFFRRSLLCLGGALQSAAFRASQGERLRGRLAGAGADVATIQFGPLQKAYPFVNLPNGPRNQCAIRISRCIRQAYPEFYAELLSVAGQASGPPLRQPPTAAHPNFRWAQDVATLLRYFGGRNDGWRIPVPTMATVPAAITALHGQIRGQN